MQVEELAALIKQTTKSKTVNFNVWAPLIMAVLPQFGITLVPEAVMGILGLGNIILRFLTKNAIKEK